MNTMRNRLVILAVAITAIVGLLACSASTLVSRRTDPTATPTKTPKPTFTVTLTPTNTPIPTNTLPPTNTPTPVTPTNTPVLVTATFTPLPSDTPSPVPPTNTPRPTPRPTKKPSPPKATATKAPPPPTPKPQFPWRGVVSGTYANCGLTRVFGFTLDRKGGLAGDVWVHYWADGWEGAWAKSGWTDFGAGTSWKGDEGNWDGAIWPYGPREGVWHVCVVPSEGSWECQSNTVDAATNLDCSTGIQVVHITFQQN